VLPYGEGLEGTGTVSRGSGKRDRSGSGKREKRDRSAIGNMGKQKTRLT